MKYKNKISPHYWLRKIYTTKYFQLLFHNKSKLNKKVFTSIYKSNHWVQTKDFSDTNSISVSGHGSNTNTVQYNELLKNMNNLINKFEIKSILDVPCGDFLWIKKIILENNINYLGVDIVEELINKNIISYKSKNINFKCADILDFNTNKFYDLLLIRDLFLHIKNEDIIKILSNIKLMNIKYIALNSYTNSFNEDVLIGEHRKVNLLIEPFNLKKPIFIFKDYENDKYFFIYELKNI